MYLVLTRMKYHVQQSLQNIWIKKAEVSHGEFKSSINIKIIEKYTYKEFTSDF